MPTGRRARNDPPRGRGAAHEPARVAPGRHVIDWVGLHLLVITNRYMQPIYVGIEQRHDLLRDDVAVILCLSITTATTAQQVARYTGRPKNSISRSVTTLEERGLLRRAAHPSDGRASTLVLTAAGRRVFADIREDYASRDEQLLAVLNPEERKLFTALALKISEASSDWAGG